MYYSQKSYNLYIISILIFVSPIFVFLKAQVSPSTITISQTEEKTHILRKNDVVALPKIEKQIVSANWANIIPTIKYEKIDPNFRDREEMLRLSNQLGIEIKDATHLNLYREAATWLGTRYRWAGSSKKGTDCSGLTTALLKKVYDKDIARSSYLIADKVHLELEKDNLEPGDLVFFTTRRKKRINHVGVYLGDGQFIHASRSGVVVSSLDEGYYARTLIKAGRI